MGYALLKAKSSKILKENDFSGEDASAEQICNLYELYLLVLELYKHERASSYVEKGC